MVAACRGLFDKLLHEPAAHALFLRFGDDAHRGYAATPALTRNQGKANGLLVVHQQAALGKVNILAANDCQHGHCIQRNRSADVPFKRLGKQVRKLCYRPLKCRFQR